MGSITTYQALLLYHIQVDLICLLVLSLIAVGFFRVREKTSDQKLFFHYLLCCIGLTIADFFSFFFDGKQGKVIGVILYLANQAYFLISTLTCLLWFYYIFDKISKRGTFTKRKKLLATIPMFIFTIFCLTTFLHKQVFYITNENCYLRGKLIFLHWIIAGGYMTVATLMVIIKLLQTKSGSKRKELYPFLIVVLFPLFTAIFQVFLEGSSTLQVGMMLSAVYVYLRRQNNYAYKDGLTGLNNRRRLNIYLEEKMTSLSPDETLFMIMMDVDFFKEINDTYGHPAGDQVLMLVGTILQNVSAKFSHIMCARYGGDEFTCFGYGIKEENVKDIINEIEEETKKCTIKETDISINMSIGYVFGKRNEFANLDSLLNKADEKMYIIKASKVR